jgi:carbamoyltransferase
MKIIGLHNSIESGACFIRDGQLLDAVTEERFTREKNYRGTPLQSLAYILGRHGLQATEIDAFVYSWHGGELDHGKYAAKLLDRAILAMQRQPDCANLLRRRLQTEWADTSIIAAYDEWIATLGVKPAQLMYCDHHHAHAWSAFACSPYDEATIFTMDGRGNFKSGSVSVANAKDGVKELDFLLAYDSLAFLYGQVTEFLGFKPHRHEGKVTGLAAYGKVSRTLPFFQRTIQFEDGTLVSNLGLYEPFNSNRNAAFRQELAQYSREDIAAGVQAHTEDLITRFVAHWLAKTGSSEGRNVCLAGGLFANVKVNQRIAELKGVKSVFIYPNMGDGGLVVGGACYANFKLTGQAKVAQPTVYLGPGYSTGEVATVLADYGLRLAHSSPDLVASCVEDLLAGRVVGLFNGRMEFGPRALGARTILYHTRDRKANDWLNQRMHRSEFMPFAPVTPVDFAQDCYEGWQPDHLAAQFMTRTYDCTPDFRTRHPAVVHVDGTARPQIVSEALHGDYYRIVRDYCERTGERALINTSFNMHEEPIVCSPQDAIHSLLRNIVDVLYLEQYRVVPGQP